MNASRGKREGRRWISGPDREAAAYRILRRLPPLFRKMLSGNIVRRYGKLRRHRPPPLGNSVRGPSGLLGHRLHGGTAVPPLSGDFSSRQGAAHTGEPPRRDVQRGGPGICSATRAEPGRRRGRHRTSVVTGASARTTRWMPTRTRWRRAARSGLRRRWRYCPSDFLTFGRLTNSGSVTETLFRGQTRTGRWARCGRRRGPVERRMNYCAATVPLLARGTKLIA
ncbi:hypothetical protein NRB56_18250 [Nocardia sp. RB56]|uniref:Uncharacterized protein n=1 Tax=Nocardia aurantia TaxID=2585199 RepID=A0A7K0DLT5_9NOCA|nr:hypothetical protein [Nocardia aurantia]